MSSKGFYKWPIGWYVKMFMWVWVSNWCHVFRRNGWWEGVAYSGTSGNRAYLLPSRSVLKDFTDDTLPLSVGSLFQNETEQTLKACWQRRAYHIYWWNLQALLLSPAQVGWDKMNSLGDPKRPWMILNILSLYNERHWAFLIKPFVLKEMLFSHLFQLS